MFGRKKKEFSDSDLPPLPPVPDIFNVSEVSDAEETPELPPIKPVAGPRSLPTSSYSEPKSAKVFVRIDRYKEVMRTIDNMQNKINELQRTLDKISAIKTKEAEIIAGWNALLADAKQKIDEVDYKLLKPES